MIFVHRKKKKRPIKYFSDQLAVDQKKLSLLSSKSLETNVDNNCLY